MKRKWVVKIIELPVEHEILEQKRPLLQQQPQQKQQQQVPPPPPPQQTVEAEYSSDDDIASPELELIDNDQPESNKAQDFALDDGGEELLSEEDEIEEEEEAASSEGHDYDSESSVDDSDLLKRLEEKYGKLPHRDDDDVYDEDDDDNDDWTSIYLAWLNFTHTYTKNQNQSNQQTNPNIPTRVDRSVVYVLYHEVFKVKIAIRSFITIYV